MSDEKFVPSHLLPSDRLYPSPPSTGPPTSRPPSYPSMMVPPNRSCASTPRPTTPVHGALDEYARFREIAEYMSGDSDSILIRRFGTLRLRDLLHKQEHLAALEEQLKQVDLHANRGPRDFARSEGLMKSIDAKLKEYDDALARCRVAFTMLRPSVRVMEKSESWFTSRGFKSYLQSREVLVTLDQSLVTDGIITRMAMFIAKRIFRDEVNNLNGFNQLSTDRAFLVARGLVAVIAPLILLVPVVLLCYLKALYVQLSVVVVFTIASSLIMMMAKVGNAEVFTATSAYCAVMVVFLGSVVNVSGSGDSSSKGP